MTERTPPVEPPRLIRATERDGAPGFLDQHGNFIPQSEQKACALRVIEYVTNCRAMGIEPVKRPECVGVDWFRQKMEANSQEKH